VLHESIPAFPDLPAVPDHQLSPHQPAGPDAGPGGLGRNNVNWIVEQVTATQQMGTHMDGLNHLQAGDRAHNGFRLADIVEDYGTNRLGIATLPQIVTRGLHLMLHSNSSLIAFSKIPNPTKFQKTLGVNDFYFGDPADDGSWPYPLGPMQMLGKSDAVLIGFDAPEAGDPADLARHAMDFWLTTEDLPRPGNRVTLDSDGRIRLRYTPTDLEAHQRLIRKFKGLLDAIQCRQDILPGHSYRGGRLGISAVAHQNGTIRFGTDPATSALDLNCKLHDLDNVYVVDASFFVSATAVNPTLTIIANALRVADHLAERLGPPPPVMPRQFRWPRE
jgi:GMC oxidoreductase